MSAKFRESTRWYNILNGVATATATVVYNKKVTTNVNQFKQI